MFHNEGVRLEKGTWQDICKGNTFAHVPPPTRALAAHEGLK